MTTIYGMQKLEPTTFDLDKLDYFILSSGSDSRAYEVLSKANFSKKQTVVLFHFKERLEKLQLTDSLYDYKKYPYPILKEIECEIKNPASSLEEFDSLGIDKSSKVGIDISTLTKPYFYFIIKLLKEKYGVESLDVFYTEPKTYLFPQGVFESFRTSSGPLSIIELPGFSGIELRDSKRKLIILLGFDGDLSKEISIDVSPNDTVVVNGFPSYTQKFKDISLISNEKLVSDHNIKVEYSRANNPFEIYNLLEVLKNEDKMNTPFLNIAPLGTKPMALGACLFALHNPEVRIVYPLPEFYENKYSDMSWNTWIYNLPLDIKIA